MNTSLGGASADGTDFRDDAFHCHQLSLVSEKVANPLRGGSLHGELGEAVFQDCPDDGVKLQTEVHKQDLCICLWGVEVLEDEMQSHFDCIIY